MTEVFRPIETQSYDKLVIPSSFGKPVRLEWLAIKQLVIDPEYQRGITGKGRGNVRRIATAFNWSMFAPVIVAAAGSNKFAIVDGQHRVTAAALCGIDKVPCAIIEAIRSEQAAAFRAINGNVTPISSIQLHHAGLAAGDEKALAIARVCARADVTVLKYPKAWNIIEPGETMSPVVIFRAIKKFGEDCVITALRAIRESGEGQPGVLRGPIIYGTSEVLADHQDWREAGGALIDAFDDIDLADMLREASAMAARTPGSSATDQFEARLVAALEAHFKIPRKCA